MTIGDTNKAGSPEHEAAFDQWWQHAGLKDPRQDGSQYYFTAINWARNGYLAAMKAQRDLIIQVANAVFDETVMAAYPAEDGAGVIFGHVDITAIVDRHATPHPTEATPIGHFTGEFAGCGDILQFVVRARGALPPAGALIYTQPPAPTLPPMTTVTQAILDLAARPDEQHNEPGPIIRQFGYQPLFNAISSATQWREGRTIEISVLAFQKALLDAAQKGGAA